jgi:hypothetical protein
VLIRHGDADYCVESSSEWNSKEEVRQSVTDREFFTLRNYASDIETLSALCMNTSEQVAAELHVVPRELLPGRKIVALDLAPAGSESPTMQARDALEPPAGDQSGPK